MQRFWIPKLSNTLDKVRSHAGDVREEAGTDRAGENQKMYCPAVVFVWGNWSLSTLDVNATESGPIPVV